MQNNRPRFQYPDSSTCYTFDDLEKVMQILKSSKTVQIKNPQQQKFANLILDLNNTRTTGSSYTLQKKHRQLIENIQNSSLETREINEILNAVLISKSEYILRSSIIYTLRDVVLFLLYAQLKKPISGRTMITKQIFLSIKEIFNDTQVENPRFVPYRFGPYSFRLSHILSNMQYDGLISVNGKKNTRNELFSLTNSGLKIAKKKFNSLTKKQQSVLADKRKSWDQLHQKGILSYVYDRYPEYTSNSKIAHIYKSIVWGRGTG